MLKKEAKTLWDEKLNEIFKDTEQEDMDSFFHVLSIVLYDKYHPSIGKLYKQLGLDQFTELITNFSGMNLQIPNRQDFREAIILTLSYYYKNIKHMDWKEIKDKLDFDDFAPLRAGRKLNRLDKVIKDNLTKIFEQVEE